MDTMCHAMKKNGNRCGFKANFGHYCGHHRRDTTKGTLPIKDNPKKDVIEKKYL
jgi:hypothetical protein